MGNMIANSEKVQNLESTANSEAQLKICNQILNPESKIVTAGMRKRRCNSKFKSHFLIVIIETPQQDSKS